MKGETRRRLAFAALIAAGVLLFLLLAGVCAYAWMEYAGRAEMKKKQAVLPEGMILEGDSAAEELQENAEGQEPLKEVESLAITSESLNQTYPMFASSLMNLIQNSESKITKEK